MAGAQVLPPFPIFTDIDGEPLDDGLIYVGQDLQTPGSSVPSLFWDRGLTIPATSPISTIGGYPSNAGVRSRFYSSEPTYSITVINKHGTVVYESPSSLSSTDLEKRLADDSDPLKGAALVGYQGRTVAASLNDLAIPITKYGAVADWNGTTGTNNTAAVKAAFASVSDYQTVYVPHGEYLVDVVDADLTDIGFNRDFALIFLTGKNGVVLSGPGHIHFRTSSSSKRAILGVFKDCFNCHIKSLTVTGDLVKLDAVPNSETGVGSGFMFYNCESSGIRDSFLKSLIIPWWITGQPKSPATVTDVSSYCYVTNTVSENFEQCSTFGAGASCLIVSGCHFIDADTAFKVSQNPSGDAAAGKAGRIIFIGNTIYWRSTAQFSKVWFAPTFSQAAVGVMVESSNVDVLIADNIIDLSSVTAPSLPLFSNAGPIVTFTANNSGTGGILDANRITIQGGQLIAKEGYSNKVAIDSSANIKNLVIQGVRHVGGIRVSVVTQPSLTYGDLVIKGNVGKGLTDTAIGIVLSNGRYRSVHIEQNSLEGNDGVLNTGDMELMFLTGFVCDRLVIKGNALPNGTIGVYGAPAVTCTNLRIAGNSIKKVDLSTIGTLSAAIVANDAVTDTTAYNLVLDAVTKANCRVAITGNSTAGTSGANTATAVSLNGGILRLEGNAFNANGATAFAFDSSVLLAGGEYFGSGAPTQQAITGTKYADFAAGADGAYIKTTPSGTAGWFRVDTFISGTATVDIPSVASLGTHSFDITATGAIFGNTSIATGGNGTGAALIWSSQVSAADTVKVTLLNPTGSSIDPASQTITVRVFK